MKFRVNPIKCILTAAGTAAALLFAVIAAAENNQNSSHPQLLELTIEQLMEIDVYSVSKKDESLADAAAAVVVLTSEDIRRSGAQSIPEALRMVPGLHVAQLDNATWSVSSRGYHGIFPTKLLVLVDGRSVYTPIFSGVYWNSVDTILEDIEQIEVIRGPGGTIWGANAVNGVINIITKSAAKTAGTLISAGGGSEEPFFTAVRQGVALEHGAFRVSGKYYQRDSSEALDGSEAFDESSAGLFSSRGDFDLSERDSLMFGVDHYDINEQHLLSLSLAPGAGGATRAERNDISGSSVIGRWQRAIGDAQQLSVQSYFSRYERNDFGVDQRVDVFDIELQHHLHPLDAHAVAWGMSYRHIDDLMRGGDVVRMADEAKNYELFSAFIQDEITLLPETLRLIAGVKVERHTFTGLETQPNLRMIWTPDHRQSIWAAYSRAVRLPSRVTEDIIVEGGPVPLPGGGTISSYLLGDGSARSENLDAYEIGYRHLILPNLQADLAAFWFAYTDAETYESGMPQFIPEIDSTAPILPITWDNKGEERSIGAEAAIVWEPIDNWRLQAAYWILDLSVRSWGDSTLRLQDEPRQTVRHQAFLRSLLTLNAAWELDAMLRFVDRSREQDIDAYAELDLRLGWRPSDRWEISLLGRNLLHDSHLEYIEPTIAPVSTNRERAVYAVAKVRF